MASTYNHHAAQVNRRRAEYNNGLAVFANDPLPVVNKTNGIQSPFKQPYNPEEKPKMTPTLFTRDEIAQLYEPFPLAMHSIREGYKASGGKKIRWFVYLDRTAIQRRLDNLFPGEWEFIPGQRVETDTYVSYSAVMKIRGMSRGFNGGQAQETRWEEGARVQGLSENVEKGAMTDTIRRCASLWGLGVYLYDSVDIYTDAYDNGDWDAKRKCEADAKRQFMAWYQNTFGDGDTPPPARSEPPSERPADAWNMTALAEATKFLYTDADGKVNTYEQSASLKKHTSGDNALIAPNDKLETAIAKLIRYKTGQVFDANEAVIEPDDLTLYIHDALDSSYSEWRGAGKSPADAWQCIQDALKLRFPDDVPF